MAANHGGFVERERLSRTYQTSVNLNVSIILIWNRYYMKKKFTYSVFHLIAHIYTIWAQYFFFPPFLMSDHFKHHGNAIWLHMPIYIKLNLIVKDVLWTEKFHCFSKLQLSYNCSVEIARPIAREYVYHIITWILHI